MKRHRKPLFYFISQWGRKYNTIVNLCFWNGQPSASHTVLSMVHTIVREYVLYVFLKIQKNTTLYVFLKRHFRKT